MAKMKVNLSGVKDFLFAHGEKVALGVCAAIAIVLGGQKLMDAAGAGIADGGKPWPDALKDANTGIKNQINGAQVRNIDMSAAKPDFYDWKFRESRYEQSPYSYVSEVDDKKRRNPIALKMLEDPKSFRLDYLRTLVFVHDDDKTERKVKAIGTPGAGNVPTGPKKGEVGAQPAPLPELLKKGQTQRFVVVQGIFPMKQQVEEFRKALKLATQKELFEQRDDLPRILGLNVVRFELTEIGGQVVGKEPAVIVEYDPRVGALKLQPALEKLLREAMYDDATPEAQQAYLYEGLAMPLPKLAYARYPKFQFPGWEIAWSDDEQPERKDIAKGGGAVQPPKMTLPGKGAKKPPPPPNPMGPPGAMPGSGADVPIVPIPDKDLREVDPILSARLFGNFKNITDKEKKIENDFNVFHVLGEFPPPPSDEAPAPGQPPIGRPPQRRPPPGGGMMPPVPGGPNPSAGRFFDAWDISPPEAAKVGEKISPKVGPKGKVANPKDTPQQPTYPAWERDALVRFIDADVQPGKTYSYAIQVRIANPNYKKDDKVAAAFLASVSELQDNSLWVTTPSITIPQDYYLYAMDQWLFDEAANPGGAKKETKKDANPHATTFQIHQFLTENRDLDKQVEPYVVGDWAVVERQVVRKGERIGAALAVPLVSWNKMTQSFEVPKVLDPRQKVMVPGARVRLKGEEEAPVLVDFIGGRKLRSDKTVEEETALEALIVTSDGKLRVHNSRDDSEAKQTEALIQDQVLREITRQERWQASQRRIRETQDAATPATKGPTKN